MKKITIDKLAAIWLTLLLGACASQQGSSSANRAPIEDRGSMVRGLGPAVTAVGGVRAQPLPGAENAGKPGYYTVKSGDTLIRIGLDSGQNWRDIARWNQLDRPSQIEVDQVLRVVPPTPSPATTPVAVATPVPMPSSVIAPLPIAAPQAGSSAPAAAAKPNADDLNWIWPTPASNTLLAGFDEAKNKGLDIGGKAGDSVLAAADGRVVYAGSGLRGYGNLIIVKHNETFLSAYAHNQTLLVKEDQSVIKGQKIAEMGQSDTDKVKLHFEIRRQGKPVDPAQYLPKR